ncbi:MAG: uroporphyrinogen-III synthase, partial [Sphingomicrobium sp.]
MKKLVLLRPEPGLSASAERARALGLEVIAAPLFRVEQVEWSAPDPTAYDALLLTSANALRHGGAGLQEIKHLPVHAVGATTADAARDAGFTVASVGEGGVDELLARLPTGLHLLHLAGHDRYPVAGRHRIEVRTVYRSIDIADPGLPSLDGLVVAVHSARAGGRLADLAHSRDLAAIAAISAEAARGCGEGWGSIGVRQRP